VRRVWVGLWSLVRRYPFGLLFAGLLAIDWAFIGVQIAVEATDYGFNGAYRLSLETEQGVAQAYGWVKAALAAILLFQAWRRYRSPAAGFWAGALTYLALDDALEIHERVGGYLTDKLGLTEIGPLRGQDLGEALVYLAVMVVALVLFIVAERRDSSPAPTMLTLLMVPIVFSFLVFAVALDLGGFFVPIAVEDGGELIALTALLATAAVWTRRADDLARLNNSPQGGPPG